MGVLKFLLALKGTQREDVACQTHTTDNTAVTKGVLDEHIDNPSVYCWKSILSVWGRCTLGFTWGALGHSPSVLTWPRRPVLSFCAGIADGEESVDT
jgi:hypothetical protein